MDASSIGNQLLIGVGDNTHSRKQSQSLRFGQALIVRRNVRSPVIVLEIAARCGVFAFCFPFPASCRQKGATHVFTTASRMNVTHRAHSCHTELWHMPHRAVINMLGFLGVDANIPNPIQSISPAISMQKETKQCRVLILRMVLFPPVPATGMHVTMLRPTCAR